MGVRWSEHALEALVDREVDRVEADKTLEAPETVAPGEARRRVYMRRYFDAVLQQEMLLRIVIEVQDDEIVVVTLYKTSRLARYLKGVAP